MKLAFIVSSFNIGDNGRERLANCLRSINNIKGECLAIVSDQSTGEEKTKTRNLCANYGATFLHQTLKLLNLPKLNNRGIELAINEGFKIIGTTGIDFLFHPYICRMVEAEIDDRTLIQTHCHCLKKSIKSQNWHFPENWYWPAAWHEPHEAGKGANGGFQVATVNGWLSLGGFEELMAMRGGMDNDIEVRSKRIGMKIKWIGSDAPNQKDPVLLHQWHEVTKWQSSRQISQRTKNWNLLNDTSRRKLDYLHP